MLMDRRGQRLDPVVDTAGDLETAFVVIYNCSARKLSMRSEGRETTCRDAFSEEDR